MLASNWKKIIALGFMVTSLSACRGPMDKTGEPVGGANFVVKDGKITFQDAKSSKMNKDTSWQVDDTISYNLEVCLQDRATRKNVPSGHKFQVKTYSGEVKPLTVQENHCVSWVEDISFNVFSSQRNHLMFTYELTAAEGSVYSGSRVIRAVVNPWNSAEGNTSEEDAFIWKESEEPLVSESLISKSSDLIATSLSGAHGVKNIPLKVAEGIQFRISKSEAATHGDGVDLEIDLSMLPYLERRNKDGEYDREKPKKGKYKLYAHLVASGVGEKNNEKLILTPNLPPLVCEELPKGGLKSKVENYLQNLNLCEVDRTTGRIRSIIKVNLNRRVTKGRLMLAINLVPFPGSAPSEIQEYQALYFLEQFDNLVGDKKPILRANNEHNFNFTKYVKEASNFESLLRSREARKFQAYDFSIADARFERVLPGETATRRTIQFRVRTCIFDNILGSRVKNRKFQVYRTGELLPNKILGRSADYYETDDEGCLNLPGIVTHSYYAKETLKHIDYKIVAKNINSNNLKSHKNGKRRFEQRLDVYVNPWDEKWTFGRDGRVLSQEYMESLKSEKTESRFFISNFGYETLNFGYEIDEFLNLKVKKMILLHFDPYVLRYSGIVGGRNTVYAMRDGLYLLKVALQKDYLDPAAKGVTIVPGNKSKTPDGYSYKKWDDSAKRYKDLKYDELGRRKKQSITAVTKIVRVNNNKIITPIELSVQDLRLMRIRSQFFIQLEPIDERLVFIANNYDKNFSGKVFEHVREKFDSIMQTIAEKRGRETKDQLLKKMRDYAESLDDVEKARELSREDQANLIAKVNDGQKRLNDLIENLRAKGQGLQERAIDNPEALKDLLVTHDIYEETMKDFEKTDFTVTSAAPFLEDLNLFVEPFEYSGLQKRTFVGPLTFLLNSNSSHLRPTDNLDEKECETDDCDSLKNWGIKAKKLVNWGLRDGRLEKMSLGDLDSLVGQQSGEKRSDKYYGSIKHMTGIHVDDLLEEKKKLDAKYEKEQKVRSNISNYMNLFGLQFVSLADEDLYSLNNKCETIYRDDVFEKCYEKNNDSKIPYRTFIDNFNDSSSLGSKIVNQLTTRVNAMKAHEVTKAHLKEMILTGETTDHIKESICYFMVDEMFKGKEKGWLRVPGVLMSPTSEYDKIRSDCNDQFNDPEVPSLVFDRKLRVKKVGRYYFLGGKQMNINIGSSLNFSRSLSVDYSASLNPLLMDINGPLKVSAGTKAGKGESEGTNISEQTFLVMQMAAFDIKLDEYEPCVAVRWNPEFFVPRLHRIRGNQAQTFDYPGGFFICSGEIVKDDPRFIREHFYYFTQHFTDGDMLDPGNIYNHPWLLSLRGTRDASAFISMLEKNNFVMYDYADKLREKKMWPIHKMIDVYLRVLPSFPSIYNVVDGKHVSFPHNQTPRETFEMAEAELYEIDEAALAIAAPGIRESVSSESPDESVRKNLRPEKQWLFDILKEAKEAE